MRKRLGECLVQSGLITEADLRSALGEQRRTREHLGVILERRKVATEQQIAHALALQLGFPYVSLVDRAVDPAAATLLSREMALDRVSVPIALDRNVVTLAMADPLQLGVVQEMESRTGYRVRQVVAARGEIIGLIERSYPTVPPARVESIQTAPLRHESMSIDSLVEEIVARATATGVSETRIEATDGDVQIRERVDGPLRPVMTLARDVGESLIGRLKMRAAMDPRELRLPQDGRLRAIGGNGQAMAFRVSTRRTAFGEMAVLRPAVNPPARRPLASLGLAPAALERLVDPLRRPSGLVLFTGPAGSGVSTTMRATLDAVPDGRGLAGEMGDAESVGLLLNAARSDSLVLATLREPGAAMAVDWLMASSWSPDLVAGVLAGIVTTRLVRRLCDRCRRPVAPGAAAGNAPSSLYEASACTQCSYTGYRGFTGIFEVLVISESLRGRIAQGGAVLREAAVAGGMVTLAEDGLAKVEAGVTTFAELRRAVGDLGATRSLCLECGAIVTDDQAECSRCGYRCREACRQCGRSLRPEWGGCPYCARGAPAGTLPRRLS